MWSSVGKQFVERHPTDFWLYGAIDQWRIQNFIMGADCRAPKFEFLPEKGGIFWCILG